eukprot:2819258-Prymnesium_polylepis.1
MDYCCGNFCLIATRPCPSPHPAVQPPEGLCGPRPPPDPPSPPRPPTPPPSPSWPPVPPEPPFPPPNPPRPPLLPNSAIVTSATALLDLLQDSSISMILLARSGSPFLPGRELLVSHNVTLVGESAARPSSSQPAPSGSSSDLVTVDAQAGPSSLRH